MSDRRVNYNSYYDNKICDESIGGRKMNDFKYFRKVAFSIGLGLGLGKLTVKIIEGMADGILTGVEKFLQDKASKGDTDAQRACDVCGIKYKKENEDTKVKMGFHV